MIHSQSIKRPSEQKEVASEHFYGDGEAYADHFLRLISPDEIENNKISRDIELPPLGSASSSTREENIERKLSNTDLTLSPELESILSDLLPALNCPPPDGRHPGVDSLPELVRRLLPIFENYIDFLFVDRTSSNSRLLRLSYCLHIVNHLTNAHNAVRTNDVAEAPQRDQGFTRARVLVLVPFRNCALRVIEMLELLVAPANKGFMLGKARALREFGHEGGRGRKPGDYQEVFGGNCDDHFRMGVLFGRRRMTLYVELNSADVVIASPLGLKTLMAEGRKGFCDFLCSVEVVVVDQADVLFMQNWTHVMGALRTRKVEDLHGVDIMRIHEWQLNELTPHYRQLLVFSAQPFLELSAFFSNFSTNYAGRVVSRVPELGGVVGQTGGSIRHIFQRVTPSSLQESAQDRFDAFTGQTMQELARRGTQQFIVYISSYFDYTRVRNHCKREQTSFCFISEYSPPKRVHKARDMFFNRKVQLLVVTERFHFYHRYVLRGADGVVFYSLPTYPQFYVEFCGMCPQNEESTVISLFDRFDSMKLNSVCGTSIAQQILQSVDAVFVMKSSP